MSQLLTNIPGSVQMLARDLFTNGATDFRRGSRFWCPPEQVFGRIGCGESIEDLTVAGISVEQALLLGERHGIQRLVDLRLANLMELPLTEDERQAVDNWRRGVAAAPASPVAHAAGLELSAAAMAALQAMGLADPSTIAGMSREALDRALAALSVELPEAAAAIIEWWLEQQAKPPKPKRERKG